MKRNLFLSLVLLALPLAAESISGSFSTGNGGVAAVPSADGSTLTVSGNQLFSDCVANGQGGVFAVLVESTLTLHTESGDSIVFTDNRDCAAPSPSGVGFRGVPNDIYLGAGAALVLETAADSDIILNSGITADFDSSISKSGEGTWALAGTAEAARVHGNVFVTEGTLALGEGCVFGSSMGTLSIGGKVTAAEGAAFGFGIVVLEEGGNITAEQPLNLMPGQTLGVYGGSISGTLSTYRDSTLELLGGSCTLDGDLKLGGGTIVFSGGSLSVTGNVISLSDTILELMPQPWAYEIGGNYTLLSCESGLKEGEVSLTVPSDSRTQYRTEIAGNSLVLHVSGEEAAELTWQGGKNMVWTTAPDMQAWQGEKGEAEAFYTYDRVNFTNAGKVTIAGNVTPHGICVENEKALTFSVDKKLGGGISGQTMLSKSGAGTLTLNDGNSYTDSTYLLEGTLKATGSTSFGTGEIRVMGGTLDLGGKEIANALSLEDDAVVKGGTKYTGELFISASLLKGSAISLAQTATLTGGTIDGVLSGTAGTDISGDVFFNTKQTYKGSTTVQAGGHLTLGGKGSVSGNISLLGGVLTLESPKGLTLAKNTTLQLNGGTINGLVTIGAGSTLVWHGGDMKTAPALKGGTLDLGGKSELTLTGSKAQVAFGDKSIDLPGKGIVRTVDELTVKGGTVTVSALNGYDKAIFVSGGTLKLSTGKVTTDNEITVSGNAAVVNGKMHFGDIIVNGTLAKGSNITIAADKTVQLNGTGVMLGTIAGAGTVDVNASIDATAAKITAAHINLNNGTFTNTKGIKLAKGQTLNLGGASLNLGPKGALATAAGSTLVVSGPTSLTGSLTLGGGELVFAGGTLDVDGTLTLSKAMTVKGSGSITYTTLKPFKGDISVLFGGAEVVQAGNTLTITGEEAVGYRLAPAPLDMTPALPPAPVTNPVADAMVQADWGIIDAERAFMGAVNSRHQHAALLDKGRGAAWVSAFGSSVRHGNKGAHHGSDGNIEGAAFGLEHAVSETGSIGLAVGRSKNRLSATGVTHLRQETAHVALYGQKHLAHGFTADAAASYGDTQTKLGAASWTQKSAALTARLTHARQLTDATAFRTFGGFCYEATDAGSIGSAHTGSVQNVRGELGAGITHRAGKAHLYAEAALTGDMVRHNPTADLDGLRTHGANPGRIGIRATLGGLYEFTDTWSGTASYGIETESRSTSHTFNVGVSKSF